MAKHVGDGHGSTSMAKGGNLHRGLKNRSPAPPDGKVTKMSASVNSGSTRSETAKTPKTLGPREA